MKTKKDFTIVLFLSLMLCVLTVARAEAVNVIRNGDFGSGLTDWNINPVLPSTWNPLSSGAVNLHPTTSGFTGTIIYQNLNVSNIGGITVNLSITLTNISAPPGNTVAVNLLYADTSNVIQKVKVLNPANSSVTTGTISTANYTFPSSASKLVKIEISKEDFGQFTIDDIMLSADGVTAGNIPTITSISPASGAYNSQVTITGSDFGASRNTATDFVFIGGSIAGVTINNWSDTSIVVTVKEPARSGGVNVLAGSVESNIDKKFNVESPYFTIEVLNNNQRIIKGDIAGFTVKVNFHNGFTTSNGINFSVSGISSGVFFTPVPIKNSGGVLLKIDTANLVPGTYNATVQSVEGASAARTAEFTLEVVTVNDIKFYEFDLSSQRVYLTSKDVTVQGQLVGLFYEATDSNGHVLSGVTIESSNSSILGIYKRSFGYEFYALDSGSAYIIATAPDGTERLLTVNITLGTPKITSLSLSPQSVPNTYTGDLNFSASSTDAISSVGYDYSGMTNFSTDFLDTNNLIYSNGNTSVASLFKLTNPPTDLGTVIFHVNSGTAKRVIPMFLAPVFFIFVDISL